MSNICVAKLNYATSFNKLTNSKLLNATTPKNSINDRNSCGT